MNIANLIIQLQSKVNDSTYDQLAVSKSIELLKTGQVNYVNTYSELPAASTSNGYMYYILGLGLYFSNGITWNRMVPIENYTYIWAWGNNNYGNLGDNTTCCRHVPAPILDGSAGWSQISGAQNHSFAIKTDGTMWAWGSGNGGKLGNNTETNRSSPVLVIGGFADWCQASGGNQNTLAVRTNGTAWAWGCNGSGQLGNGTTTAHSSPVSVIGGFTNWRQVSSGDTSHSLGVRQNGSAWAWGYNNSGRLGDNTTTNRSSPVSVVGGFTDWCQVSAGRAFSLGLRQNGTLWAWGANNYCQLGASDSTARSSPVSVVGGFTDWCQVSAGHCHSIAVRQNGTAWGWGRNNYGVLGINDTTNRNSPVQVCGGFTDWCQASAGYRHSLALRTNGNVWAWGYNNQCQLGVSGTSRSSPILAGGGFNDWCQVAAVGRTSLGIRAILDL